MRAANPADCGAAAAATTTTEAHGAGPGASGTAAGGKKQALKRKTRRKGYPLMPRANKRSRGGGNQGVPALYGLDVGMVARLIPTKQVKTNDKAKAAIRKEWDNLVARDCWDIKEARPWKEVKAEANADQRIIHLGSLLELCYLKGSELSELERKYNERRH